MLVCLIFAPMNTLDTNNIKWSENVIIADADYIDRVAFDLIVNFERMINRRIQPADMAQWAVCIALDGGLREGEHETQVVLIHDKQSMAMKNFRPANYEKDLNAQAFKDDKLGEFIISSYPTEEKMVGKDDFRRCGTHRMQRQGGEASDGNPKF